MAEAVAGARRSDRRRRLGLAKPWGVRALRRVLAASTGLVLGVDMWLQLSTAWSRRRAPRSAMTVAVAKARRALRRVLAVAAAVALGVDAYVHLTTAPSYAANGGAILNEGNVFFAEAAVAGAAAIFLLVRPGRRAWIVALAIAATALAAVLVSTYVDVGAIGPIPNLYEPTWSVPGKVLATAAEGCATALSITGLMLARYPWGPG